MRLQKHLVFYVGAIVALGLADNQWGVLAIVAVALADNRSFWGWAESIAEITSGRWRLSRRR